MPTRPRSRASRREECRSASDAIGGQLKPDETLGMLTASLDDFFIIDMARERGQDRLADGVLVHLPEQGCRG